MPPNLLKESIFNIRKQSVTSQFGQILSNSADFCLLASILHMLTYETHSQIQNTLFIENRLLYQNRLFCGHTAPKHFDEENVLRQLWESFYKNRYASSLRRYDM